ncbi:MAG: hypothetical protein RLZZ628_2194 [Bacteroidota bacterium]|jgi:hypothetical protein
MGKERTFISFDWAMKKIIQFNYQKKCSRHIENRRIEKSVLTTAEDLGIRKASAAIAKKALAEGADWAFVSKITGLDLEDIELLSKGKKIDID